MKNHSKTSSLRQQCCGCSRKLPAGGSDVRMFPKASCRWQRPCGCSRKLPAGGSDVAGVPEGFLPTASGLRMVKASFKPVKRSKD